LKKKKIDRMKALGGRLLEQYDTTTATTMNNVYNEDVDITLKKRI